MSKLLIIICFVFAMLFSGCGGLQTPQIIYKEKFVPVACIANMPKKPLSDGSFEGDKQKMIYYKECEDALKKCIGKK